MGARSYSTEQPSAGVVFQIEPVLHCVNRRPSVTIVYFETIADVVVALMDGVAESQMGVPKNI